MTASRRLRLLVGLAALLAAGALFLRYAGDRGIDQGLETDYRVPLANPPTEPDRPDLLEEPRIDETDET